MPKNFCAQPQLIMKTRRHGVDLPDMLEGDHGKLAAPAKSDGTSAEDAEDVVAAVLGAVEAGVGALQQQSMVWAPSGSARTSSKATCV